MKTMKINTNENKTEAIKLHFNMCHFIKINFTFLRMFANNISFAMGMLTINVFDKFCNIDFYFFFIQFDEELKEL